jgi:ligand-binding SRPBCC domain-containing protein
MYVEVFRDEIWLPRPKSEIFPFFAKAENLEMLTPPWLSFHIVSPLPIEMKIGALIDYRLKVKGFPIKWRTRISGWDPPNFFSDDQLKGPYRQWHHEHIFEDRDGGTLARDVVHFAAPGGRIIHWLMIRRDVRQIFAYRSKKLREIFGDGK